MLKAFVTDRRGNFAVITALALVPLVGAMGMAMDYSRALSARDLFQAKADAAALSVAKYGPTVSQSAILQNVRDTLQADAGMRNLVVDARWTAINDYTVTISGDLPLSLTQVIPGVGSTLPVKVETVARFKDALRIYKPPNVTQLDPEAGDYNRVYAYCFNKDKKADPVSRGRSPEIAIADNGGTSYRDPMPVCQAGEMMSFRLYNVRNSRTTRSNWDRASVEHYDYHTDTGLDQNQAETYDLGGWAILETVLCPSLQKCKPKNEGGVIPYGKNRTPERAKEACSPGKFMYYGWEDRPPGRGDSDRDYDDIRVIIECPVVTIVGDQTVRLIR